MKPGELFPGAVVVWDGETTQIFLERGELRFRTPGFNHFLLNPKLSKLQPLPISPAVLRGLGLSYHEETRAYDHPSDEFYLQLDEYTKEWIFSDWRTGKVVKNAHQLQALSIHLYGVELVWNQDEYNKAIKEGLKP